MLRVLYLMATFGYLAEATLDFRTMKELLDSVLQLQVAPSKFTRCITKEDGNVQFVQEDEFFEITDENLIGGTPTSVTLVEEAYLADTNLQSKYSRTVLSTRRRNSAEGVMQNFLAFSFQSVAGDRPCNEEILQILATGINVTVKADQRQCALQPHRFDMQIVRTLENDFGLRMPQSQSCSLGLNLLHTWLSVSFKNADSEIVNLEAKNMEENKEYFYVVPKIKSQTEIPSTVNLRVFKMDMTDLDPIVNDAMVVNVYNKESECWDWMVQIEVDKNRMTDSHTIIGYHGDNKNGIGYELSDQFPWQFVLFKKSSPTMTLLQ